MGGGIRLYSARLESHRRCNFGINAVLTRILRESFDNVTPVGDSAKARKQAQLVPRAETENLIFLPGDLSQC